MHEHHADYAQKTDNGPRVRWPETYFLHLECRLFLLGLVGVLGFPGGSDHKESACNAGYPGSTPGEGNSNALQYSHLENSVECIVHGVAKSRT